MAVCMYREHERQEREAAHASYLADPQFPAFQAEAKKRGYRKATISEVNASAERVQWAPDLYCWKGGLWVVVN
ncbi:hypothetical protein [Pseudomonas sp. RW3S2]|uniref:hypothetical protein n=1 Tax=Pseudomonas sp. RW3S2 TaxID=485884 RepID=UPI001644ECDE|nr:hypothetical protein [Pseudomonas sp. RW3S2]MBC3421819.1 hypothetical protein [Pseudomonas sp. RW3S2]